MRSVAEEEEGMGEEEEEEGEEQGCGWVGGWGGVDVAETGVQCIVGCISEAVP